MLMCINKIVPCNNEGKKKDLRRYVVEAEPVDRYKMKK
jgi:hypothetical protein